MHERIQKSLLLGRRTKGDLAWFFHRYLQVLKGLSARNLLLREGMADYSRVNY